RRFRCFGAAPPGAQRPRRTRGPRRGRRRGGGALRRLGAAGLLRAAAPAAGAAAVGGGEPSRAESVGGGRTVLGFGRPPATEPHASQRGAVGADDSAPGRGARRVARGPGAGAASAAHRAVQPAVGPAVLGAGGAAGGHFAARHLGHRGPAAAGRGSLARQLRGKGALGPGGAGLPAAGGG
ncbi:unnamed protein product, partial [Effrenium voratum]